MSGKTTEHLKPIADNPATWDCLSKLMARGQLPQEILQMVRMGHMTALKKTTGVRGVVAGDIVENHLASDSGSSGEGPQCALSTRAGCIAHALQAVSDADLEATMLFVCGISAYDSISRGEAVRESVLWFPLHLSLGRRRRGCSRSVSRRRTKGRTHARFSPAQHRSLDPGTLRQSELFTFWTIVEQQMYSPPSFPGRIRTPSLGPITF